MYGTYAIFFFYKPTTRWYSDSLTIFYEIVKLGVCYTEHRLFLGLDMFMTPSWFHTLFVLILVYMERGDI